jgi:2-amino-4-hydroxy-6-hydroxymethyldihydropteridine diphosphokinase
MMPAYLSLGSNLGARARNLEAALALLAAPGLVITRVSSIYESEPMYLTGQPWFLNLVAEIDTSLSPARLFDRTCLVERQMGRVRTVPNGPREIDIDILLCGASVLTTPELEIPHPRMAERRFVLEPMAEIAPDLPHPVSGLTMRRMLASVRDQALRKWTGVD